MKRLVCFHTNCIAVEDLFNSSKALAFVVDLF